MIKSKSLKWIAGSFLALCLIFIIFFVKSKNENKHFNVILINLCSVRYSDLMAYGADQDVAPTINQFSKSSYIFNNMIGQTSWRNFWAGWYPPFVWHPERVEQLRPYFGFRDLSKAPRTNELAEIPKKLFKYFEVQELPRENFLEALRPFKEKILSKDTRPFFFGFLIKAVHFPYSGKNRDQINYSEFMSERLFKIYQQYLEENLNKPTITADKISFFALLFGNREQINRSLLKLIPKSNIPLDPLGIMNNGLYLKKWKQSPHYADDLEILKGAYRAKLKFLDSEIKDLLLLYGNEELKNNTIIIMAGDHGSAMMEHGQLHNGTMPFEEQIKVPMFVHFPQMKDSIKIEEQMSEKSQFKMLTNILNGTMTPANFKSMLKSLEEPEIFSRDCPKNNFSIREKNKWKYHWNIGTREQKLYDLEEDPKEERDLSDLQPETMAKFEELVFKNQKQLRLINRYACPTGGHRQSGPPEE